MNKLVVFLFALLLGNGVFAQEDPVIMTIDDTPITKSEFLQIYLKNNDNPKYDKASLDEYMELFKKFKLKVAEAEALGYDSIPKLVKELDGYRKQLARPYLIDSTKNKELVQEAYDRTKQEIRASHILVRLESNATPEDTLAAWNRLMELKKRIDKGEDFAKVAQGPRGSEDPSVKTNGGDLGYFTAFQMVFQFEDVAYSTPVGNVSNPFRTRFGYHIMKVFDKRPARGTIETAHLMIAVSKDANKEDVQTAQDKINELYDLIQKGENFEELVSKHSDDPSSNQKGGVLPAFGTGTTTRMVPEFSEAAFALKKDGEISKPVRTDYGFHIIKRLNWKDVAPFSELKKDIENRVAKDERAIKTQSSFVNKLKKSYKFKRKSMKRLKWYYQNIDSTFQQGAFRAKNLSKNKVLFKMDKQKFRSMEFAEYLEKGYRGIRREATVETMINKAYKKWEEQAILSYEETKLPGKYPAYKALITEYHDGILLYEVMSDKVWNRAMRDTVGLKKFYEDHQGQYQWDRRMNGDIFECLSEDLAKETVRLLNVDTLTATTVVRMVNESSALNVKHRRGKYDIKKTDYLIGAKMDFKKGINPIYAFNGKYYVVRAVEILEPGPKKFDEAKGAITSDYQNFLEVEWLKEISGKHKIVVNEDVLYSLGK